MEPRAQERAASSCAITKAIAIATKHWRRLCSDLQPPSLRSSLLGSFPCLRLETGSNACMIRAYLSSLCMTRRTYLDLSEKYSKCGRALLMHRKITCLTGPRIPRFKLHQRTYDISPRLVADLHLATSDQNRHLHNEKLLMHRKITCLTELLIDRLKHHQRSCDIRLLLVADSYTLPP